MDFELYKNRFPYKTRKEDLKAFEAYHRENGRIDDLFRKDALQEAGLTGHPKAEKAFEMAWERGHSSGYHEVFNCLLPLADLLLND